MGKQFEVTVNGKKYDVKVEEITDNVSMKQEDAVIESKPTPEINKQENFNKVEKRVNMNTVKVNSPMPGSIWKILKKSGEMIKKHEVVLILEAMKMENEIVAPCEGILTQLLVNEGEKVNAGQLIFEISENS